MKIVSIGGSGFVSGALARAALNAGHIFWAVTRGEKPVFPGVRHIRADRSDPESLKKALRKEGVSWDLAIDCIGFEPEHAKADVEIFSELAKQLVFISTDFVFDPVFRTFPQKADNTHFAKGSSYGAKKRLCEEILLKAQNLDWTIIRPCHIYGPGSHLGCLPEHGRDPKLIEKMQRGEKLRLAGGGYFLQQPIYADDLAELILSCAGNEKAVRQIFQAAGKEAVMSRTYYEIIGEILGVKVEIEEVLVSELIARHPEQTPFMCHRIYDITPLEKAGLKVPSTPLVEGLRQHVESCL